MSIGAQGTVCTDFPALNKSQHSAGNCKDCTKRLMI